jgi:hypothetical protein
MTTRKITLLPAAGEEPYPWHVAERSKPWWRHLLDQTFKAICPSTLLAHAVLAMTDQSMRPKAKAFSVALSREMSAPRVRSSSSHFVCTSTTKAAARARAR